MAILKVSRMGHPVLRSKARALDRKEILAAETQRLIDDMIATMVEYHGAGLAAPQVHCGIRLFVAIRGGVDERKPIVLLNPEVEPVGPDTAEDWEGCLSIPNVRGRVPRAARVSVRALDRHGHPTEFEATEFFARVIQHETDHLDGILFLDRMTSLASLAFYDPLETDALAF